MNRTIVISGANLCTKNNQFINILTRGSEQYRASRLKPDTQSVTPYVITYPNYRLVLIDTPGFDDATRPDTEILMDVADWLNLK